MYIYIYIYILDGNCEKNAELMLFCRVYVFTVTVIKAQNFKRMECILGCTNRLQKTLVYAWLAKC